MYGSLDPDLAARDDEVGTGDDRDVEPCLAGDELVGPVGIATLDHGGADENRDNDADHPPELRGLERLLGFGRQAANTVLATDQSVRRAPGFVAASMLSLHVFGCPAWVVQGDRSHARPFVPRPDGRCFALRSNAALASFPQRIPAETPLKHMFGPADRPLPLVVLAGGPKPPVVNIRLAQVQAGERAGSIDLKG